MSATSATPAHEAGLSPASLHRLALQDQSLHAQLLTTARQHGASAAVSCISRLPDTHASVLHDQERYPAGHVLHPHAGGMARRSWRWTRACAGALTWMRGTAVHLVRQGLLGMPLAGVQGHRHVHAQSVCAGKLWRRLPILQCVLHAQKAICLGCGQRCQIRHLEGQVENLHTDHMFGRQFSYSPLETGVSNLAEHCTPIHSTRIWQGAWRRS